MNRNTVPQRPPKVPSKLNPAQLEDFLELGHNLTGIQLDASKQSMLYARLTRRLRTLNLNNFDDYLALLKSGHAEEIEAFTNVVTTNLTYFFREPHHFEFMRDNVVPDLMAPKKMVQPLRVWSAGCSSGEEPYSIAISMLENSICEPGSFKILCTDLNSEMIESTRNGVYRADNVRGLSNERSARWFENETGNKLLANSELRAAMLCRKLNIFESWPIRAGVDVIFCRNLLIYFSPDQQTKIVTGFATLQSEGAYMFLGHSEVVKGVEQYYKRVGSTIFQRTATKAC